jgi:hypothetical protein
MTMFVPSTMGHLDKFPLEIRQEIYKYLLVNPALGTSQAFSEAPNSLSPAILRTCRQIHTETSEVLYSQVFIAHCDMNNASTNSHFTNHCKTPITQKIKLSDLSVWWKTDPNARLPAMKKVRRWKLILIDLSFRNPADNQLVDFCQAVCQAEPKEIDVRICRTVCHKNTTVLRSASRSLYSLTMLRNVGRFTMRNDWILKGYPLMQDIESSTTAIYRSMGPGRMLARTFKTLAESSRPVER